MQWVPAWIMTGTKLIHYDESVFLAASCHEICHPPLTLRGARNAGSSRWQNSAYFSPREGLDVRILPNELFCLRGTLT